MASLRVMSGPLTGTTVEIKSELVIGRQDAGLTLDDDEVSRRHACVRRVGGALEIEDLGSSNGTFVDGARIAGPTLLGGGARVRVGATELVVQGVLAGATRISRRPDPQATRVAGVTERDPELTVPRAVVQPSAVVGAAAPGGAVAAPGGARAVPGGAGAMATQPLGDFQPPVRRRRRGLASRSWVPVALSFGTVIVVAIALVVYFAAR
jgi:hypothetical protein